MGSFCWRKIEGARREGWNAGVLVANFPFLLEIVLLPAAIVGGIAFETAPSGTRARQGAHDSRTHLRRGSKVLTNEGVLQSLECGEGARWR